MPDFDTELASTTLAVWAEKQAAVNIGQRTPLLEYFLKSGNVKPWDGQGRVINEPVLATFNKNKVQGIARFQEVVITPEDGDLVIPFTPKRVVNDIAIDNLDLLANSGDSKMIDLMETKTQQAEIEIADKFEDWFVEDGTDEGGKVPLGLDALIPTDPTTGTLCGFNRATTTWIRTNVLSGAKTTTAYDNLYDRLETMTNTCTRGTIKPDLMPTSQTIYEACKRLFVDKHMYTNADAKAAFGFDGIKFRSAYIVFLDTLSASTSMWFLNKDALHLRCLMSKNSPWRTTKFCNQEDITKSLTTTAMIVWIGALTMSRPRTLGRLITIS